MKVQKIVMVFATVIFLMAGCKKEDPEISSPANLLEVDFSGEWNAYKYIDYSGLVPLEIVKIEKKSPGSLYYTATKVVGDNGVPAGEITWEGDLISNPFSVTFTSGDGTGKYTRTPGMQMKILDKNTIKGIDVNVIFTRRSIDYFK